MMMTTQSEPPSLFGPPSLSLSQKSRRRRRCRCLACDCVIYNPSRIDPGEIQKKKNKRHDGNKIPPQSVHLVWRRWRRLGRCRLLLPFSLWLFHASLTRNDPIAPTLRDWVRVREKTKDEKSPLQNLLIWFAYCLLSAALGRPSLCPFDPSSEKGTDASHLEWDKGAAGARERETRTQSFLCLVCSITYVKNGRAEREKIGGDWDWERSKEKKQGISFFLFLS
jgi:hypothetical protein